MITLPPLGRRAAIAGASGAFLVLSATPRPAAAALQPATEAAIRAAVGDRPMAEGRVALRLPAIAENGNSVPLGVAVESPMTEDDFVRAVHVFADGNPNPEVASFHFTPALGRAEASTRVRLGRTQDVVAVAVMSGGALFVARAEVKVTIGGCGG
jgi:sulfur-oxidizing protein SoxY